jgi:hypothetical protein
MTRLRTRRMTRSSTLPCCHRDVPVGRGPDPIFMLALCQLLERQEAVRARSTHWFDPVVPSMSPDRFRRGRDFGCRVKWHSW